MTRSAIDTSAFEHFEAAGWEQQAAGYDAFFRPVTLRTAPALLDAAAVVAGTRLLDVGTGPGHVAGRATERGAAAVGVDIADAMIAIARHSWPAVDFRTADAHQLPFPDRTFHAVTANFAVLHLGRPEVAVREFVRVLKPGGRVALTVWDEAAQMPLLGAVAAALEACGARPPDDIPVGPSFFRFSNDDEFRALLEAGGLDQVTVETLRFTHRISDPDAAWAGIVGGTVRTSALVLRQPTHLQHQIRVAFFEILDSYRRGSTIDLPISVKLAAGMKASNPDRRN